MTQHQRVTFTQGREVLEHAVDYLRSIVEVLEALKDQPHADRAALFLSSVLDEQRALLDAIDRFVDDAPAKAMDTYAQYVVELPGDLDPPPEPLDNLGLLQWLVGRNRHLDDTFTELAGTAATREIGEVFAGIARQVQAHDRRLSKEYQRMEDL